jgi:hypothetical protein
MMKPRPRTIDVRITVERRFRAMRRGSERGR